MRGASSFLRARFGGLGGRFWALWIGLFLNRSGQFVQPLMTWWLTREHGLSVTRAGAVVALYGVGATCGATLGGALADRFGRRRALLVSALGAAVVLSALSRAEGLPAIVVGTFALAVIYELHRPAVQAMVADLVSPIDRVRAYGLIYVAVNLGFAVAPAVAGLIADRSYPAVFVTAAVIQLVWAGFIFLRLPETRPAPRPGQPTGSLLDVFDDKVFMAWTAALCFAALIPHQAFVALAIQMQREGIPAETYGTVIALNGVLIVAIQPWLVHHLARLDPVRLFAASAALQGIGFAMHGLGLGVQGHVTAITVWTLGEIVGAPVFSSVAAALAPPHLRARYQGLTSSAFATAGIIGPLLGGAIMDYESRILWPGCLVIAGLALSLTIPLGPPVRARLALARSTAEATASAG